MANISQHFHRAINTIPQNQKINWRKQLTPVIVGVIIVFVFFFGINPYIQEMKQSTSTITKTTSTQVTTTQTTVSTITTTSSATITSTITQTTITTTTEVPLDIKGLVLYTLKLINDDRATYGLSPVALGNNSAAQSHAEDLARLDCLSHWGSNGMKPYIRYTIFGGKNYVEENAAATFIFGRQTMPSSEEAKSDIKDLEYQMMYNDSSSNWGHRNNILSPEHTHVNIGIVYRSNITIVIQDFENVMVNWQTFDVKNSSVSLKGKYIPNLKSYMVLMFYDPLPTPLTASQLRQSPYNDGYSMGDKLGAVLNKGYQTDIPYIYASKWNQLGSNFEIVFNFSEFAKKAGVYTLVLEVEASDGHPYYATSYSVFIKA